VDLALPEKRAGVERRVNTQALHQVGVRLRVQVEAPLDRGVAVRDGGVLETLEYPVVPLAVHGVLLREKLLMLLAELGEALRPLAGRANGDALGRL
jgi:hypothetical protein